MKELGGRLEPHYMVRAALFNDGQTYREVRGFDNQRIACRDKRFEALCFKD